MTEKRWQTVIGWLMLANAALAVSLAWASILGQTF
jgi:hypothetical protein